MIVGVVTRRVEAALDVSLLRHAARHAARIEAGLLVTPGAHPDGRSMSTSSVQEICDEARLPILAQCGKHTYLFRPDHRATESFLQRFETSKAKADDVKELHKDIVAERRTVEVAGKKFRILLCGESEYFKTRVKKGMTVELRYQKLAWTWNYDAVLNPAHKTVSKRRPLFDPKLEHMSRDGRTVIHTSNNVHKTTWANSLTVYTDGQCILRGDGAVSDTWRLYTVAV